MPNRYGADRTQLDTLLAAWGEPRYRSAQVWRGLWTQRRPLEQITTIPKAVRARLAEALPLALHARLDQIGDRGTTRKWLWVARDGAQVETVLMRHGARTTVCVSSQAGCAMACTFCATGQAGFERHLDGGEIVEQVLRAQHACPQRVSNVVFMGMGEPLANYEPVAEAVCRLHDDLGISARHITISTVGVVPGIRRLADAPLPVTLAVSLHAPDDALRTELVPLNHRYPLADVLGAAGEYMRAKGRRVTFEYVMLERVNDSLAQADALGRLLTGAGLPGPAHVNLIPYNPTPGIDARATAPGRIRAFAARLAGHGLGVTVRANRGVDIDAACGQLRARFAIRS